MLNHDTGQMDWDRFPIGGSSLPSSSYYINPDNMFDMATPYGRELMDETYPSSSDRLGSKSKSSSIIAILTILFIALVCVL